MEQISERHSFVPNSSIKMSESKVGSVRKSDKREESKSPEKSILLDKDYRPSVSANES